MENGDINTRVVIAGAGPAGMVLAIELGRRGIPCVLLNDRPDTATHPKANAISAAFRDPRFRPLSKQEWEKVEIEISILTDPRPLDYSDKDDLLEKIRPGIDGVIIKKDYHQSTFLPQVWEQLPDKKNFFNSLSP